MILSLLPSQPQGTTQITSQPWKGARGQGFDATVAKQRDCHVPEVLYSFSHTLSPEIRQLQFVQVHFGLMLANYVANKQTMLLLSMLFVIEFNLNPKH